MSEPVKPITPAQAAKHKKTSSLALPPGVIEAFNELIAEKFDGREATIKQCDAITRIALKMDCKREDVLKNHWLDVEAVFESVGWRVEYDKPGYNEVAYEPFFKFRKKS